MAGKQIIQYKKECFEEPYCSLREVLEDLARKEQECERLNKWLPIVTRLEEQFKSHEKAKGINYKTYTEQVFAELVQLKVENEMLEEELQAKEQECEASHGYILRLEEELEIEEAEALRAEVIMLEKTEEADKYKQALTEVKEVLQLYNNTKIGTDKGNGIFEFEVCNDNVLGGKLICHYDTNPARQALQKIREILDEN